MIPRLPNSKKWTSIPEDFVTKIKGVMTEMFPEEAERGEFIAEGRIYPQEIVLRLGFLENGRLRQVNFEASSDYVANAEKNNAMEKIYACADAAAQMMESYFVAEANEEEMEFPLQWQEFKIETGTIFLQFSTINSKLEDEADRLLGVTDKRLVYGVEEEEAETFVNPFRDEADGGEPEELH